MKTTARTLAATALLLLALTGCSTATNGVTAGSAAPGAVQPLVTATGAASPATAGASGWTAVKQVHSPGAVAMDEQLTSCKAQALNAAAGDYLPDPACTPGAIDPAVTQDNIDSTICKSGYTATVRPPASATDKFKAVSLRAYAEPAESTTELDHLVSLELGGTNSASNLWPEMNHSGATGTTNPKDSVENTLHKAVCGHKVKLADAQNAIARNWITAVTDLGL